MKLDMSNWKESVLTSKRRFAVPILSQPGIDLIGESVLDAVTSSEVQARAIEALIEHYSPDAVTMIMDLTIEAEAFGAQVTFHDNDIPTITGTLLEDVDAIESLAFPALDAARIPNQLNALRKIAERVDGKPVFAECIGPFSLAARLFGISEIMTSILTEPSIIHILLDKCTHFLTEYVNESKRAGANGIVMAEPAAGLLSGEHCDEFSSAYVKKIISKTQDEDFFIVLHNCGNSGQVTRSMISTGAGIIHVGNKVGMTEVLQAAPSDMIVMGNLDPAGILKCDTAAAVRSATAGLLSETRTYSNFIISSGCDVPLGTPEANIRAFFSAVDDFNSVYARRQIGEVAH